MGKNAVVYFDWYGFETKVEIAQLADERYDDEYRITFVYNEVDCTKLQNFLNAEIEKFYEANQYEIFMEIISNNENKYLIKEAWDDSNN